MLTPEEVEFLAGSACAVTIVPTIRLDNVDLQWSASSTKKLLLRPNEMTSVPLWLAKLLRQANMCRIIPPMYMRLPELSATRTLELQREDEFAPLPDYWYEAAMVLLKLAPDEVDASCVANGACESVGLLVQQLRELRMSKLATGFKALDGTPVALDHVGLMELNVGVKPFLLPVMDLLVQTRIGPPAKSAGKQAPAREAAVPMPSTQTTATAIPSTDIQFFSQQF